MFPYVETKKNPSHFGESLYKFKQSREELLKEGRM